MTTNREYDDNNFNGPPRPTRRSIYDMPQDSAQSQPQYASPLPEQTYAEPVYEQPTYVEPPMQAQPEPEARQAEKETPQANPRRSQPRESEEQSEFDTSFEFDNESAEEPVEELANNKVFRGQSAPPPRRKQRPATPRVFSEADNPRRMRVIRSSHTGCFGWLFGFIGLFVRMFIITGIVVAICIWIGWQMASSFIDTPEVPVPNIRGLRIETALSVASENGMSIMKERNEPSVLVAPGEIIDQKPGPGTRSRKGGTIRVVISGETEERRKVPDVTGISKEDAIAILKGANLEVGDVIPFDDITRPAGIIISQTPQAGDLITDAVQKVNLLVSKGK